MMPKRPRVILNAAMTLDGKIATRTGDSALSGEADLMRVHELRREVDAILVGIGTVLEDDPRLTIHRVPSQGKRPLRVVADSRARIPLTARLLNGEAPTLVAVSRGADPEKVSLLREKAEVFASGEREVDLVALLRHLREKGVRTLLLEGGGTLNWGMLQRGLVDEVRIAISPCIVGGEGAVTLVEGEGFGRIEEAVRLRFLRCRSFGDDLVVEYAVVR
jgi:2,5-diamino-6-(ribosylamino)-4(3H)-pyrimidinone 5'-phosphate reductase